jgi:methionyl aminopeptidase
MTNRQIEIKSPAEVQKMRKSGALLAQVFAELAKNVAPGITTGELDTIARSLIEGGGAKPAFLGYRGFPATLCTSVNDEIVHGIPGPRVLNEGDIVAVDCGLILEGFYADRAYTFPIGKVPEEVERLLAVTEESLNRAIAQVVAGNRLGAVSSAVQQYVVKQGFSIVENYTGHGIGRSMHELPEVPNFGNPNTGPKLKPGLVIAIEPMVNIGTHRNYTLDDGWTVVTEDGAMSAHFEHTVAVTENGPLVLTA